jgi:hypothetical protein
MSLPVHWQTAGNVRFADICKRLEAATLTERYELLTFVRRHCNRIRPRISDDWLMPEMLADFYRNGNDFCRNCLETGFLEHAMETPVNRPFFQDWASDPILASAFRESLKWGLAHETIDPA